MDPQSISTFFSRNVDTSKDYESFWESLCFISANEWHWTQSQLLETDIPYIFVLLKGRDKYITEMNKKR